MEVLVVFEVVVYDWNLSDKFSEDGKLVKSLLFLDDERKLDLLIEVIFFGYDRSYVFIEFEIVGIIEIFLKDVFFFFKKMIEMKKFCLNYGLIVV